MTRATLIAQGWTNDEIRRQVRAGTIRRLWPAVYTDLPIGPSWVEYERTVRAAGLVGGWGAFSHQSSAVIHRIPLLKPGIARVHTTIDGRRSGGFVSARRHVHPRPMRPDDVTVVDGLSTTSRARTAVDVAMSGSYEQALAVFDAVRLAPRFPRPGDPSPVPLDEIQEALDFLGRRPGRTVAQRALADSVERSESVGESWSRSRMIQWKLPAPALQRPFTIRGRQYYADFRWGNLVGEFDGDDKYESDADRRRYEKRRDSDFGEIGMRVCHWNWQDLEDRRRFFRILTGAMVSEGVIPAAPPFPG